MKAFYIFIIAFLPFYISAHAQMPDYHVQVFNESGGIRNYYIRSMVKDQKDFLWILYENRVQRFDGKYVKEFKVSDGLLSIICDAKNQVWCTSRNEVYRFKNDHEGFLPVSINDTSHNTLGYVFELSDHNIYLHTGKGFYVFDENKDRFDSFPVFRNRLVGINSSKMSTWGTTIFFCSTDSAYSYNVSTKILKALPGVSVFAINALNDHLVLLSDWKFASFWFDFQKHTVTPVNPGRLLAPGENRYFFTNDLVALDNENYLITTQKGLLRYNSSTGEFKKIILFHQGHILQDMESLASIYMDRQRNIWISFDQGLIYFSADEKNLGLLRNASPNEQKSKWNNDVRKFAEDEKGNIWFVTVNGFNYWDLSTGKITPYSGRINNKQFLYPSIRGVAYDGRYLVLGPTNLGVWLFDPRNNVYKRPRYENNSNGLKLKNKIESDFISHIERLKNGDYLISSKSGAYLLDGKTYLLKELNLPEKDANCIFVYQDDHSRIWIATRYRLHCYDSSYGFLFTAPRIGDGWVRCIWQKNDHEYFVGSNGLFSLDISSKPFTVKKLDPYFDNSNVNFLFKDKKERLWIGSDNGLFLYDPDKKKMRSFDYANNLQGKGFYNQGLFLSSRGILYVGGTNGINYFCPENIEIENEKLQPAILNMVVNEDDSSFLTNRLPASFSYKQNSVRFNFIAPYFANPNQIQYRYKLAGLRDEWIDNQHDNTVTLTSLPAGNYSFTAAASINGYDWFESDAVHFAIQPPFWNTWWFYLAVVFAASAILYAVYRFRVQQIMKVQLVRNRISSELHDDIGSKLTNINILTTLAGQTIAEPVKARSHLERIATEVQTSSEALNDIVWSINSHNDSLEEIIARMRRYAGEVLSGKNVVFNVNVPNAFADVKFPMEKRHDVYLLFKESINNIHKHANASDVLIELFMKESFFNMHIRDNGKGLNLDDLPKGNGLANLKQRTEKWRGSFSLTSHRDQGTDINIKLPLKTTHSNGR